MSDLEKRIKELEQWAGAAEERESALSGMVTELERQMEELCFKGFVPHHVQCNLKILDDRINELESRQPAPEPEQRGNWMLYDPEFCVFKCDDKCIEGVDVVALLNAYGITPDSQPAPKVDQCFCPAGECAQATDGSCRRVR